MPLHESSKIYGIIPKEIKDNYDVLEIIKCIVDKSEFLEYKKIMERLLFAVMPESMDGQLVL